MGRPRKTASDAPDAPMPHIPEVSVLARRLADPDSVLAGSNFVPLKDDPDGRVWAERWGNFAQQGRYGELIHRKGWVQVLKSELASLESIPDLIDKADGYVWRGDKGKECLLKMPAAAYRQIKRTEAQRQQSRMHSMTHLRNRIAEEGARQFGDGAGEELLKLKGDVRELPPERFSPEDIAALPDGQEV